LASLGRPFQVGRQKPNLRAATPLAVFSGTRLRPVSHDYLRRIHILGKTIEGTVTTAIAQLPGDGHPVWQFTEESEPRLGGYKDVTVADGKSLYPISRVVTQYGSRVELSFSEKKVSGAIETGSSTLPVDVPLETPIMTAGGPVHFALTTLSLTEGHVTSVILLDPSTAAVLPYLVKVEKTETLVVPAGTFEAFRIKVSESEDSESHTMLWIETAAERRLLKTEVVYGSSEPKSQTRIVSELVK
jgi:hypothetical protein